LGAFTYLLDLADLIDPDSESVSGVATGDRPGDPV